MKPLLTGAAIVALATLGLAIGPADAHAAASKSNWVFASQGDDGETRWYIDSNSITYDSAFRYALLRMDEPDGSTNLLREQFDCADGSSRTLIARQLFPNGRVGVTTTRPGRWLYFRSGSNIEAVARYVCP